METSEIGKTVFDHLNLDTVSRNLICQACGDSAHISMAPLERGLSGASTWLVRWQIAEKKKSKYHVFKIGERSKISREYEAIKDLVTVTRHGVPHFEYYENIRKAKALIRQEFVGRQPTKTLSLHRYIEKCSSGTKVTAIVQQIYSNQLKDWHSGEDDEIRHGVMLRDALDWWMTKLDLQLASRILGRVAIDSTLQARFQMDTKTICRLVEAHADSEGSLPFGVIHGDLHAQNILVDRYNVPHLIDYGWAGLKWRLVDFLMLECSLKLVVSPPQVLLDDYLEFELAVDSAWSNGRLRIPRIGQNCVYRKELQKIGAGVLCVRRLAFSLGACDDRLQYRKGLALLTACLATLPGPINRVFLFHSLAYHLTALRSSSE